MNVRFHFVDFRSPPIKRYFGGAEQTGFDGMLHVKTSGKGFLGLCG